MDPIELLFALIGINKSQMKEIRNDFETLMMMDARNLTIIRILCEKMNIMDGATFTDILSRYANEYYEQLKDMNVNQLLAYWKNNVSTDDKK